MHLRQTVQRVLNKAFYEKFSRKRMLIALITTVKLQFQLKKDIKYNLRGFYQNLDGS